MFGNMFQDEQQKVHNSRDDSVNLNVKNLLNSITTNNAFVLIIIIGLLFYFPTFFNGFTGDDGEQLVNNPLIHSLNNLSNYFKSGTFYNGDSFGLYYRPLLSITYAIIYSIAGATPFFFHAYQLLLHCVNAILLFILLKRFLSNPVSFFLSVMFLIHPINSESVYYISAMQENLFFLFGLSGLLLLESKNKIKFYLIPVLFFFSLLSKETGILFIAISLLYASFFRRKDFWKLVGVSLVSFITFFIMRFQAIGFLDHASNSPIANMSLIHRISEIPAIIFFYLKTFFLPLHLSSSHVWITYGNSVFENIIIPISLIVIFLGTLILLGTKYVKSHSEKLFHLYIVFMVWFMSGLLLHLQLIPLDATVADRWFYFPIVGLLGILGILLQIFEIKEKRKLLYIISVFLLFILGVITFIRGFDWKNNYTLSLHDVSISHNNYVLEKSLSYEYLSLNKLPEAEHYAKKSVEHYPYATNLINLGQVYLIKGDYKNAKDALLKALSYGDYYLTYEVLAVISTVYGDPKENIKFLQEAIKKYPNGSKLWVSLAIVQYNSGQKNEARDSIAKAYRLYPNNIEVNSVYTKIINNEPINLNFSANKNY